jgi:hypothetical protein
MEPPEHLLQCLRPGRFNRQWRADQRVRSTTSFIVLEMSAESPVLMASQKRLNVALLLVGWTVDLWLLVGSI